MYKIMYCLHFKQNKPYIDLDYVLFLVSCSATVHKHQIGTVAISCQGLKSHQQQRSYGDGISVYSLIRQIGEVRDRTGNPWFTM